jgi:hypothetical protein
MDQIQIGDIITAYHKGYHKVTHLFDLNSYTGKTIPQIQYRQILNSNFTTKGNGRSNSCAASFCKKVTKESITKWAQEQADFYLNGAKEVIKLL